MISNRLSEEDIVRALRRTGGAQAAAAHLLGISPRTLQRRLDRMAKVTLGSRPTEDQLIRQQVELRIMQQALEGDLRCGIFYLKYVGWGRESVEPTVWKGYPEK